MRKKILFQTLVPILAALYALMLAACGPHSPAQVAPPTERATIAQEFSGLSSDQGLFGLRRGNQNAGVQLLPGAPPPRELKDFADSELGPELSKAEAKSDTTRINAVEAEIERRELLTATPLGPDPIAAAAGVAGVSKVTPEVAIKIIENIAAGHPGFKPDKGLGGCSWFTTEGNPYTATGPEKSIEIKAEISRDPAQLVFKEKDLQKIFDAEKGPAAQVAEAQLRAEKSIPADKALGKTLLRTVQHKIKGIAERRMWERVGEQVAASKSKLGEVIFEPGSNFSKQGPGKFAVVADAHKIKIKDSVSTIIEAVKKSRVTAEPVVVEAAEALAKKMKWSGRVRGVFRYGGRVLIVVGATLDVVRIYYAQDRKKEVVTSAGGWVGATAGAAAFAKLWAAADVAGPWAWVAHGVGTLAAGGVGYWIGSETTRTIYELSVEP